MTKNALNWCFLALFTLEFGLKSCADSLFCWNKQDGSVLRNQSCETGNLSIPNMVTRSANSSNDTKQTVGVDTCYLFDYSEKDKTDNGTLKFVSDPIHARILHRNQSCDFDGICENVTLNKWIKTKVHEQDIHLFCCNTTNCNHAPAEHNYMPVCYQVISNGSYAQGHKERCKDKEASCVRATAYNTSHHLVNQSFFCDSVEFCHKPTMNSQGQKCMNQTRNNMMWEICCCHGDLCFKSPLPVRERNDLNDTSFIVPFEIMHQVVTLKPKAQPVDWLFVGGLIAAGVLVLLITVVVPVIVWRSRKKQAANEQVSLSYSPLLADTVEDEEDIRMLLP